MPGVIREWNGVAWVVRLGQSLLSKADVGLGLVDNTSDLGKPLSTAAINALAGKEPTLPATPANPTTLFLNGNRAWQPVPIGTLSALTDSLVTNPATGQVLRYDVANNAWVNVTPTPANLGLQASFDATEPTVAAGTASQFYRGDKTWAAINTSNLIQNPGFEDLTPGGAQTLTPHWSLVQMVNSSVARSGPVAAHFRVLAGQATAANTDVFVANGPANSLLSHPRCAMGETYRAEFWVRNGVVGTTTPSLRPYVKAMDSTGAVVQSVVGTATVVTTAYTLISVEMTVSAAAAQYIIAGINAPNALVVDDAWRVDDMALRYLPQAVADTGWIDLVMSTGFTRSGQARARQMGRQVFVEVASVNNAAAIAVSTNGGTSDTIFATLPAGVSNPGVTQRFAGWAGGRPAFFAIPANSTGQSTISITAADGYGTATSIAINGAFQFSFNYAV